MTGQDTQAPTVAALSRRDRWLLVVAPLVLVTALTLGAYAATLRAGFVFDDLDVIVDNRAFLEGQGIGQYAEKYRFRQETMRSYKRDLRLSGGETPDPKIFHVASVLTHLGVVWLLYWLFFVLGGRSGYSFEERATFSALAAGLFALHPVQTEAVAYISGRSDVLATLYLLIALVLFLVPTRFRPEGAPDAAPGSLPPEEGVPSLPVARYWLLTLICWGSCLAVFVKALLCKEIAAVLPALGVAVLWLAPGRKSPWNPRVVYMLALLFAGVAALLALRVVAFSTPNPDLDRPLLATLCTNLWALVRYVLIFLFPFGQSADHDFDLLTGVFDGRVLAGILLLGLAGAGVRAAWRRAPEMALGIIWFLVSLTPTTSVVPIADLFVERRLYLPSIGLCILLSAFAVRAARRIRAEGRLQWIDWGRKALAAGTAVLLGLTVLRTHVWANELTLWSDAFTKAPEKTRVVFNLGTALLKSDHPMEGSKILSRLFQKDVYDVRIHLNVAGAYLKIGWLDYAERLYRNNVLALEPDNSEARYNLAVIAERKGDTLAAQRYLEEAVKLKPQMHEALVKLATYALGRNEARIARDYFEQAAAAKPEDPTAHRYLALLYSGELSDPAKARENLEALIRIEPKDAQHWFNLGVLADIEGRLEEAREAYRRALDLDPEHVGAYANLGALFQRMGAPVEACQMFREAAARDGAWSALAQQACGRPQAR